MDQKWIDFFSNESKKDYYQALMSFVVEDGKTNTIYPPHKDLFNAFKQCSFDDIKVVILAQDPYINKHEAHGLAFSVQKGITIPPSLRNIFKELKVDCGIDTPVHGCLSSWAEQGVFLLNSVLTVQAGKSGSHRNKGWETFTDNVIAEINAKETTVVFLLWGNYARNKKMLITNEKHLILEAGHPSPFSAHLFFGCKHFSKANAFLKMSGAKEIDWRIV